MTCLIDWDYFEQLLQAEDPDDTTIPSFVISISNEFSLSYLEQSGDEIPYPNSGNPLSPSPTPPLERQPFNNPTGFGFVNDEGNGDVEEYPVLNPAQPESGDEIPYPNSGNPLSPSPTPPLERQTFNNPTRFGFVNGEGNGDVEEYPVLNPAQPEEYLPLYSSQDKEYLPLYSSQEYPLCNPSQPEEYSLSPLPSSMPYPLANSLQLFQFFQTPQPSLRCKIVNLCQLLDDIMSLFLNEKTGKLINLIRWRTSILYYLITTLGYQLHQVHPFSGIENLPDIDEIVHHILDQIGDNNGDNFDNVLDLIHSYLTNQNEKCTLLFPISTSPNKGKQFLISQPYHSKYLTPLEPYQTAIQTVIPDLPSDIFNQVRLYSHRELYDIRDLIDPILTVVTHYIDIKLFNLQSYREYIFDTLVSYFGYPIGSRRKGKFFTPHYFPPDERQYYSSFTIEIKQITDHLWEIFNYYLTSGFASMRIERAISLGQLN